MKQMLFISRAPALRHSSWHGSFANRLVIEHHGYNASCPNGLLFFEPTQSVCPGHFMASRYGRCIRCNSYKEGWPRSLWMLSWTLLLRWLCQRASVNVPITRHVLNRLGLAHSRVVYYGIPDSVPDSRADNLIQRNADMRCFAYVGRLVALKGLPVLVEAAKDAERTGLRFSPKIHRRRSPTDLLWNLWQGIPNWKSKLNSPVS